MTNFDELLNGFKTQKGEQSDLWTFTPSEQPKETPEDRDLNRLEQDIQEVFANRKLLNKVLATFLGVAGASGSVHLMARLGLPAIASGTVSGILLALFIGNALSKVRIDNGKPSIDSEFFVALAQSGGIAGALWTAFSESRQLEHQTKEGMKRFYSEVKAYEVKPSPSDTGRLVTAGVGVVLLLIAVAVFLKGGKRGGR